MSRGWVSPGVDMYKGVGMSRRMGIFGGGGCG